MYDEYFFIFVSFVLAIALAFRPCKRALVKLTDGYSQGVLSSVLEAEKIRKEAEAELNRMKKRAAVINAEVETMIAEAKEASEAIMNEAKTKAEQLLSKRTRIAMQRISQQEVNMHSAIRDEIVKHVLRAVEVALANKMDPKTQQELIADSLNNAKKLVH